MSRIGRMPIELPENVKFEMAKNIVTISGPLGTLSQEIDPKITVAKEGNVITLVRESSEKSVKAKHGLYRALIANMVKGVTQGFEKKLVFNGVGYKLQKAGSRLVMNIGFSHSISFEEIEGITIDVISNTEVLIKGIDKGKVGMVAAQIRDFRPVEPYHAYGIRYSDEVVVRKVGKSTAKK